MADGLDVIIVDDDPNVCELIATIVKRFYTWGDIIPFSSSEEAVKFCLERDVGVAIFIVDVFLGGVSGFYFLDAIEEKFPTAHSDAIIITGNASDDVVNMCVASDITYLLEKPIKAYALQLAVRAIVSKYIKFAKKLLQNPALAESIEGF